MMRKIISAAALVAMCLTAQGQMRVEPANWWVGMKNPEVQLMIHDKDVAKMEASVDVVFDQLGLTQMDAETALLLVLSEPYAGE